MLPSTKHKVNIQQCGILLTRAKSKGNEKILNYLVLIVSPFQLITKCHNLICLKKTAFENPP